MSFSSPNLIWHPEACDEATRNNQSLLAALDGLAMALRYEWWVKDVDDYQ